MISVSTFLTALAVALTVTAISLIPNQRLKALVYSLPIPITLLVVATGGNVNISHIYGLFLVTGFLWFVALQRQLLKLPIVLSIVLGALGYVGVGMLLEPTKSTWFWFGVIGFVVWWFVFTKVVYRHPSANSRVPVKRKMADRYYYPLQAGIIFVIVVCLLSIVKLLAGAVAAFPLNGIFTTYVMRDSLRVLASEFSRNSIGILAFLSTIHVFEPIFGLIQSALVGWVVCLGILIVLNPNMLKIAKFNRT